MNNARLVAFVALVAALAALSFTGVSTLHVADPWVGTFLFATLAALGGASPVRVPGAKTMISAADAFVLAALGALGPMPACVVSLAGVAGAAARRRPGSRPIRLVFNVSNVVLSTALASIAFILLDGRPEGTLESRLWPLVVATTVYFLANTGLVTGAITLESGRPFLATWRETGLWTAIATYAGLPLATLLLFGIEKVGMVGLALGIPPCWLITAFYRTHKERQELQQERIDRVESLNQELEDRVAERTRELQDALTRIESANTSLLQANERLTDANRAKSEFLANVSHELRTPLNAIIGFSGLLLDPAFGKLDEQQREFATDIHDSGGHLLGLINGILDLSKIEAGRMELHRQRIEVKRAIGEAASMVRPQAGAKDLEVELHCDGDIKLGELDPGMFRQVLVNLFSNAVKFTPAGGRVTAVARREQTDLVVAVEDTGIGIAPEHQEKIFEEFYQVDGSYSRTYEGTGLGLALVRRLMQLHSGTIEVDSAPGRGSRFVCRFPTCLVDIAPAEERRREAPVLAPSAGAASSGSGRAVLVVEDNPVNRKLVRNVLRSRGFEVLTVESGEAALETLRERRVDVVLMDLQLPGLSGLETTERIKADPRTTYIPVVALTAQAHDDDRRRAEAAGCSGFITKPIRLASFPQEVAAYLVPVDAVA